MSVLLSWIGTADYSAWKQSREAGDGPLLAIAQHVGATEVEILWDDGEKVPLAESADYAHWLEQQLGGNAVSSRVRIHPCNQSQVMDFGWVYHHLEELYKVIGPALESVAVNTSSGTPVMHACWIVFKKSCGGNLRLFRSSLEKGVESVDLPPNLTIDMLQVMQGRRSPLFDRYIQGDIRLNFTHDLGIIHHSERMKETLAELSLVARFTDVPVLLLGPPGVGKTLLANAIHKFSGLEGEFVTVDCGMLGDKQSLSEIWGWEKGAFTGADSKKEGRIVDAANGSFFLDEVGNADALTQQNLLQLLQNRKYRALGSNKDVEIKTRIIAATNCNLREEVRQQRFRQDLFDRLSVYEIQIPALRERPEDISPFATEFLRQFNEQWSLEIENLGGKRKVLSTAAELELRRYDWPGNVRELENVMTRLAVHTISSGSEITPEDVQDELSVGSMTEVSSKGWESLGDGFELETALNRVRFHYLQEAWGKSNGNKSEVQRLLGYNSRTPIRTLIEKLKSAGYPVDEFR